jgi:hypothetical protein
MCISALVFQCLWSFQLTRHIYILWP